MKVASFLLVAFAACTRANDINLDDPEAAIAILQGLWDQTDADEDGALSLSEFNDAANKVMLLAPTCINTGPRASLCSMALSPDGGHPELLHPDVT